MRLHKLVHSIYEPDGAGMQYPILQHTFIGKTKAEALGYFNAHLTTDAFLRACEKCGRFHDFTCVATLHWETLTI